MLRTLSVLEERQRMSNQNEWTRDLRSQDGRRGRATERRPIQTSSSPRLVPVRRRAHPRRSISTVQESLHIESLFPPEHGIHRPSEFVRQNRQGLALAVFLFQTSQVRLTGGIVFQEQHGRFRERPLQMRIADLVARRAVALAGGFFLRLHQTAKGPKRLGLSCSGTYHRDV